jgi:phage FluMu gp28-like protein
MQDANLAPDPWQAELLRSDKRRHLLLCSRQSGKSTACAALALHTAFSKPESLTLLISRSHMQAKELFKRCLSLYEKLPGAPKRTDDSRLKMEVSSGSRILSLPSNESTIRGYSADLVILDEAARCDDAIIGSITPMLGTTNGRLIGLSTPHGKRGWFWEAWSSGHGWARTRITADDCPRLSDEFLQEQRDLLGEWVFRQEFLCEFVDTDEQFFSSAVIEAALSSEVAPLWPG